MGNSRFGVVGVFLFIVALKGASFGRCDLRVDRCGAPFMLEINPNCGVYYLPEDAGSAGSSCIQSGTPY